MDENMNIEQTAQEAKGFLELLLGFWQELLGFFKYIFNDMFLGKNP